MRLYGIPNDGGFPLSASNSHFSARADSGKCFDPESRIQQQASALLASFSSASWTLSNGPRGPMGRLAAEKSDLGSRQCPRWCISPLRLLLQP